MVLEPPVKKTARVAPTGDCLSSDHILSEHIKQGLCAEGASTQTTQLDVTSSSLESLTPELSSVPAAAAGTTLSIIAESSLQETVTNCMEQNHSPLHSPLLVPTLSSTVLAPDSNITTVNKRRYRCGRYTDDEIALLTLALPCYSNACLQTRRRKLKAWCIELDRSFRGLYRKLTQMVAASEIGTVVTCSSQGDQDLLENDDDHPEGMYDIYNRKMDLNTAREQRVGSVCALPSTETATVAAYSATIENNKLNYSSTKLDPHMTEPALPYMLDGSTDNIQYTAVGNIVTREDDFHDYSAGDAEGVELSEEGDLPEYSVPLDYCVHLPPRPGSHHTSMSATVM